MAEEQAESQLKNEKADSQLDKEFLLKAAGWVLGALFVAGLGVAGWIARQVWHMNGVVTATADRVDRIVDVLPELRVRIAQEEIKSPIKVAITVTHPSQESSGAWVRYAHLVDTEKEKCWSYRIHVKGREDLSAAYSISGLAHNGGDEVHSYQALINASLELRETISVPTFVHSVFSFTFHTAIRDYKKELEGLLGVEPTVTPFTAELNGWKDLASELRDNAASYKPASQPAGGS